MPPIPLTRTVMSTTITTTKTVTKLKESRKLSTHPVRHVEKQTTPQRNAILEPMQPTDHLPGTEDRKDKNQVSERANQSDTNEAPQAAAHNLNLQCLGFTPELRLTDRRQLI